MTGERRDESVQFSLHELMRLEDERLEREKREKRERAEEAEREAAEAAAKTAEAARKQREARERAEAGARERERLLRAERAAERAEEEARREAMSRAAVEQARIAVEARARAEEAERERRHELELARLRAEVERPHGAGMLVGTGIVGAALAVAVCGGGYFMTVKPAHARAIEGLEGAALRAEAKANDVGRANLEQARRIAQLEQELRAASEDIERLRTAAKRAGAPAPIVRGAQRNGGGPGGAPSTPDKCEGSLDPMCGLDLRRPK